MGFYKHYAFSEAYIKPFSSKLTLGQYADLTRTFSNVAVRRLDDPEFKALYRRIRQYGKKLKEINVTDKYVAMHARGSDPVNERLNILRTKARSQLFKIALKQPVAIVGGILHFPILALAQIVGTKMGVDEFGDRSVGGDDAYSCRIGWGHSILSHGSYWIWLVQQLH